MRWPYAKPMEGHPEITELRSEPDDVFNFGGSWHQDSMNYECPPKITMLYSVECPPVGGDTSYSNQYLAWEFLSDELKAMLRLAFERGEEEEPSAPNPTESQELKPIRRGRLPKKKAR